MEIRVRVRVKGAEGTRVWEENGGECSHWRARRRRRRRRIGGASFFLIFSFFFLKVVLLIPNTTI